MRQQRIYLETSAIGYLDEQSSPMEMDEMQQLWELIKAGVYVAVISELTITEINNNKNKDKAEILLDYIAQIPYERTNISSESLKIAEMVKTGGLITADKHSNDRLHIGCALDSGCDIIVSMNFKHLVNVNTIRGVRAISLSERNHHIDILSPASLIYMEGDD